MFTSVKRAHMLRLCTSPRHVQRGLRTVHASGMHDAYAVLHHFRYSPDILIHAILHPGSTQHGHNVTHCGGHTRGT